MYVNLVSRFCPVANSFLSPTFCRHAAAASTATERVEFDLPAELALVKSSTRGVTLTHETRPAFVHAGAGCLRVAVDDPGFFFGRYDVRMTINGQRPLGSRPAIPPGDPVRVDEASNTVRFSNGAIEVVFEKQGLDPGSVSARLPGGPNLLDSKMLYRVLSFKDTKARNIIERVAGTTCNRPS